MIGDIVQTAKDNGGGYVNSRAVAFGSAVTAGNLIVVVVGLSGGTGIVSVTDNQSNTYIRVARSIGGVDLEMYYAYNVGGGSTTVTVEHASDEFIDTTIILREYEWSGAVDPLDTFAEDGHPSSWVTSHPSGLTPTTAQADSLLIGAAGLGGQDPNATDDANFSNLESQGGHDLYSSAHTSRRIVSAIDEYEVIYTTPSNWVEGAVILAVFSIPAVGGDPADDERSIETHGVDTSGATRAIEVDGEAVPQLSAVRDGDDAVLTWTYGE